MRRFAFLVCLALLALAHQTSASQTLKVALTGFPPTKGNPHSEHIDYLQVWAAMFDPLTMITDDGDVIPWLATSWEQESPTAWVFSLREGVDFSNGRPFDATAVVEAVRYLASEEAKGEAVAATLSYLSGAEAIDDQTVRIITDEPRPAFPYEIQLMRIPEPDDWRSLGREGFASAPIGTGPFALESWGVDRIFLNAVADSWRAPVVASLEYFLVRDPNARMNGLLTNEFHMAMSVDPDSYIEIEAAGGTMRRNRIPSATAIMFNNVGDPRFSDPKLRQALNYAVNKQAIIDVFFNGVTEPATQPAPRAAVGFNTDLKPYPYNPEKARQLLAEAGYEDGLKFNMDLSGGSSLSQRVYQQVAADLARVGVQMTINTITRVRFLSNFQDGQWEGSVFPAGYFTPTLDGLSVIAGNSCLRPNSWYCDPDIVPQIEAALAEPSFERRTTLVKDLMAYAHDSAVGLFLYESATFTALGPGVEDFGTHGSFVLYENVSISR